jgi:DNA-binding HxlR family transcriptional regulator
MSRPTGALRFNEFHRRIEGMSRIYSRTLRRLRRDGLLSRTVTPTVPLGTGYAQLPNWEEPCCRS